MRSKGILYITSKDGETMNIDDYFSSDWMLSEEYHESDYGTQVTNFMVDFIENE